MILGLDLDGCSYDFVQAFRDYYGKIKDTDASVFPEQTQWNFNEQWGISEEEYFEIATQGILEGEIFWKGEPYPDAVETINRLGKEHEIHIVTHRIFPGAEIECIQATEYWLGQNNIHYDQLTVTENKLNLGVDVLLDDAIHNVKAALDNDELALIFDRPYNWDSDLPRCYSWYDFEQFVRLELREISSGYVH